MHTYRTHIRLPSPSKHPLCHSRPSYELTRATALAIDAPGNPALGLGCREVREVSTHSPARRCFWGEMWTGGASGISQIPIDRRSPEPRGCLSKHSLLCPGLLFWPS